METGQRLTTVGAALLMMIGWGSSPVATRFGLQDYDPGQLTLLRFLITSAVLALFALATRMRMPARRDIVPLCGLGLIGISITQLTFSYGVTTVDPGTATFIFMTVPVMTAVLARFLLDERLSMAGWLGIALTVAGTSVLVLGQSHGFGFTTGALVLLFGAFSEACYFILQKPLLLRYTSLEVTTWAMISCTVPLLIFWPGLPAQVQAASPSATAAVAYAALGAGVLGYFCMSVVNARLPASAAVVLMAGMPPVALLTAWLVLDITPPSLSIVGGLISLAGVLLVTQRGYAPTSYDIDSPRPVAALSDG